MSAPKIDTTVDAGAPAVVSPRTKAEARLPGKILLATDFSTENVGVVQFACERLLRSGDQLVLFKTMVPATPAFDAFDAGIVVDQGAINDSIVSQAVAEGETFLKEINSLLPANVTASVSVELGDPGTAICGKAQEEGFTLVVVGSHSKTHVQSFLVGSVSNYLLHHCEVPVVIVRM